MVENAIKKVIDQYCDEKDDFVIRVSSKTHPDLSVLIYVFVTKEKIMVTLDSDPLLADVDGLKPPLLH